MTTPLLAQIIHGDCTACAASRYLRDQHTAHQLGPAQIVYRFHPFFGREVQVLRRLGAREEPAVVVQIEDDLRMVVPRWMLDATCCQFMVLQDQSRIDAIALQQLRDLVDQQSFFACKEDAVCGSMIPKGEY